MKLFLSSVYDCASPIDYDFSLYTLQSYFTLISNKTIQLRVHNRKCSEFIFDSGAFSFLNSGKGNVNWEYYLDSYADYINTEKIDKFIELDIDAIVGLEQVETLRKRLERRTGKQCIPVFHFSRGKQYYFDMVKEYPYVAIGGIAINPYLRKIFYKYLPMFAKIAHEHGAKIHALGVAYPGMEKWGIDSSDSSTWAVAPAIKSRIYKFDGSKMISFLDPALRCLNKILVYPYNFKQWCLYQRYLDNFPVI